MDGTIISDDYTNYININFTKSTFVYLQVVAITQEVSFINTTLIGKNCDIMKKGKQKKNIHITCIGIINYYLVKIIIA